MKNKNNKTTNNQLIDKIKKLSPYLISIIIALSIFFISLLINKIAPFGQYTLAKNDAYYQYEPMLFNFIKSIQEGTLTNFSFLNGLGNSFLFNYSYYLSSPLNILVLPFKNANTMFVGVIAIKIIITAITTTFYSLKKTNNKPISILISIAYIFSAWFLAYNQTIMWLDAFMIFPLFQYGLEKLMNENKIYIYIFTLSYIMISNFYIAWMICLYTLVYFIYQTFTTKKEVAKKLKNFNTIAFATMITMLLSFFYIYITYDNFISIKLYINSTSEDYTILPILNLLKSFFTGNKILSLSPDGKVFPNIALSLIFTISLLYYFLNKKIDKKDKIKNLLVFIFIIVLLYSKTLNYIMNCFHVPVGYCFRYSFLISFYMIHLFIENYKTFDNKIDKKVYLINLVLLIILVIQFFSKNIETKILIFNLITLVIITLLFLFYRKSNIYKYIFTTTIILEIAASAALTINSNIDDISKELEYDTTTKNYREIIEYENPKVPNLNMNLYENRNALLYFSSMQYNQVLFDLQTLGCKTDNKATMTLCPNNQVFNTLLNIKTNNDYYLEKIYTSNKNIKNIALFDANYFQNQNLLLKTIANTDKNIIEKNNLKATKKSKTSYKVEKSGTYYLNLKDIYQVITIGNNAYTFNKDLVEDKSLNITEVKAALHLELELNKKDIIKIKYPSDEDIEETLEIYYFDINEFVNVYNELKANQITYNSYKDNKIEGTITVDKDELIFTSIPYDKHWKVTIDGKEVKAIPLLNSLLGIECEPGTHKITLEYKTNFTIPLLISITTFIGLITKIIVDKFKQKKSEN
jgi:uncharacterized membrane protein YfhO